jgi:signal transduction histidine kinase
MVAAIRSEAEAIARRTGIPARVRLSGAPCRLDAAVEIASLRIAQEALRSVERHSGVASVSIRLAFEPPRLRLTIADDGSGLHPIPTTSDLLAANHLGIVGMQERARLVGAELTLGSRNQGGLTIQLDAPLPLDRD